MKNNKCKLYLDIDGVLLTTKNIKAVDHAEIFIDFILENFDCYWLTTHCRGGNNDNLLKMLSEYFPNNIIKKISKIKPTLWDTLKTEAIDFNCDFLWLDDYVFEAEKKVLKENNCSDNLLIVDLKNEDELSSTICILKEKLTHNNNNNNPE